MGSKENFNKAAYELFGIGNAAKEDIEPQKDIGEKGQIASPDESELINDTVSQMPSESSYIAPGSIFEGTLNTKGNVEIAGSFHGDIYAEGSVILHTSVEGNIKAKGLELVDCTLTGDIQIEGKMLIGAKSTINGNVSAQAIDCFGKIMGENIITKSLILRNGSNTIGNIQTDSMIMELGATVEGNIKMTAR